MNRMQALARPELLLPHRDARSTRFRLLLLGLRLLQGGGSSLDFRDRELLRSRVFAVAFSWFWHAPQW